MDSLNWERSGGVMDCKRRRLQHYTIKAHPTNGRFLVYRDCDGELVGGGFKSPEDAQARFAGLDYRATWGAR